MADNTQVTAGAGDVMRSVDHGGVKTQLVGLDINPAGAEIKQSAAALADATANPTVPLWAMCGLLYNGATWDRLRGDTTNGLDVDVTRLPALATGANTIGKVDQGVGGASAWKVDGSAVTQPVSLVAVPTVTEKQDQPASSTATWTSATAVNTALTVATTGYGTANVSIQIPATVTAGVITLEVSDDNSVWYPAGAVRVDNGVQESVIQLADMPGLVNNRMWAVSTDAQTQVRVRLSTVITGSGNVVVRVGTVAGGIEPFVSNRVRKLATYRSVFRATARPYLLSNTFLANTRKQFATIHHAAASTKTARLSRVQICIFDNSASANVVVDLVRITTAPVTGNPAVTPSKMASGNGAVDSTCLALPGTAGTEEAQVISTLNYSLGVTGAASTVNPPPALTWYDLYGPVDGDDESKQPTIRAGVLEGWAVTVDSNGATTIRALIAMEFTEE